MVIQSREMGYSENYKEVFEAMKKWKAAVEKKYPEINITLMYNLTGERGRLTIQTAYKSMADYERIDAALDEDEEIGELMSGVYESIEMPVVDEFYRVIS